MRPVFKSVSKISTKLTAINALICIVFITIILLVFLSYRDTERLITGFIIDDVSDVTTNALTERELFSILSDTNLLLNTFFGDDTHLQTEGNRLLTYAHLLVQKNKGHSTEKPLQTLTQRLGSVLQQCGNVNISLSRLEAVESKVMARLEEIDEVISDRLITLVFEGEDESAMVQLSALVAGYRESLLKINGLHDELWPEKYYSKMSDTEDPIITAVDDLNLRLRTLTASDLEGGQLGQKLMAELQHYRRMHLDLVAVMIELKARKQALEDSNRQVAILIEKLDKDVLNTIRTIGKKITQRFRFTELALLLLSATLVVALGLLTTQFFKRIIKNPMEEIRQGAKAIRSGDLDARINLNRFDEWHLIEEALNTMAAKLSTSYIDLQKAHDDLEGKVTERTAELEAQTIELNKAKEAAEEAARVKSEFLAKMSHEIRTPMNVVIGLTDLTLDSDLAPIQRDYLSKVRDSSRHLLRIINDILDFSKIEADKLELEHSDFMLHHVIEKMANMFRAKAAEKQIELFYLIDSQVPLALEGDPFRLGQILINLIANAVKFTDQGEIIIKVEPNQEDGVTIPGPDQVNLLFGVQDSGIGIPPDQMQTLFEPFTQLDGSMARKYEGSGLGLSVCHRLVNLMGGRIWVESEVGRGSVFYFNVMLDRGTEERPYRLVSPADIRGLKVLVVDDNETARLILEQMLRQFKFEVTTAASGQEGLAEMQQAAEQKPYDLLLVDWKMPEMDGFEMVENIRNHPLLGEEAAAPKIIMITMYGRDEIIKARNGTAAAIDGYLLKPVSSSELFNTIMELFGQTEAMVPRIVLEPESVEIIGIEGIRGARVLLVEDHKINQQVAVAILERAGLTVEVAPNGQTAVDIFKAATDKGTPFFDAVLMDIEMPLMDGYEATRQIRELEFKIQDESIDNRSPSTDHRIPIIAMTAHALKGDRQACLAAGMDDYIAKPIDVRELYVALVSWIKPWQRDTKAFNPAQVMAQQWDDMPETIPGIDLKTALARIEGDTGLYRKMLLGFMEKFDNADQLVGQYLDDGKMDAAYQLVHALKGIAGNIGANGLFQSARDLCDALETKQSEKHQTVSASFLSRFSKVRTTIKNLPLETQPQRLSSDQIEQADPAKINTILHELLQMIEEKDYEMTDVFQTLKKTLQDSRFSDKLIMLDRTIYNMDFKTSISIVRGLIEEYEEKSA